MLSFREYIAQAKADKKAIGHFNVSTLDGIHAVVDVAEEMRIPIIIGLSEGERDFVGVREVAALVKSIRESRNLPVFLNADHTYSFERVKEAIDAGFDSIIIDGAQLSFEENIKVAKKCVEYARSVAQKENRDILIEGELGFIGTSSKILDSIPEGVAVSEKSMTKPSDAVRFVHETGVDMLAPAVGNVHGMVKGGEPALNPKVVAEISTATGIPLVLHGASGNSASDIRSCIDAGVAIVHINTELRIAYRAGLVKSLSENPEELSPYKYLKPAKLAMQAVIREKISIFNS
ncbi:MAG: class II fructose-bisphosphate aldolase [Candidatus Paceibacterota bacterium]|jgi:fructose-bisphosphate aldolase class II